MNEPTGNWEPPEVLDYDPRTQGAGQYPAGLGEDFGDRVACATEPAGLPERTAEDDRNHEALMADYNDIEARCARMKAVVA